MRHSYIFLNFVSNACSNSHCRSSHPEVFLRKGVLKICSKFTGENPGRSVISLKLLCNFIEIALRHACSSVNLLHIFRTPFPKNTPGRLLLSLVNSSRKIIRTSQNLKHVHIKYYFHEFLIIFCLTIVDSFCLKFDFSLHQKNTAHKYILQRKQNMKIKQREVYFHLSQMLM